MVVLTFALANEIVSHVYPKRPDLFKDVALLQAQMNDLIKQVDVVESEVTALHVGNVRHR